MNVFPGILAREDIYLTVINYIKNSLMCRMHNSYFMLQSSSIQKPYNTIQHNTTHKIIWKHNNIKSVPRKIFEILFWLETSKNDHCRERSFSEMSFYSQNFPIFSFWIALSFSKSVLSFPGIVLLFSRSTLLFCKNAFLFLKNALLLSKILI